LTTTTVPLSPHVAERMTENARFLADVETYNKHGGDMRRAINQ